MNRAVVPVLLAALLASGCAAPQSLLPPDEDSNNLVEAIARRGRGEEPVVPEPEGSFVLSDCLQTSLKVGETCLLIPVVILGALARKDNQQHDAVSLLTDPFRQIWVH